MNLQQNLDLGPDAGDDERDVEKSIALEPLRDAIALVEPRAKPEREQKLLKSARS